MTTGSKSSVAALHCLASFDNKMGGGVHAALNVCRYLAEAGYGVEAVAPYTESDDIDYLAGDYKAVRCHRVPRTFPKHYSNSPALSDWLKLNLSRFKVVEIHGVWSIATFRVAIACKRLGIPYLVRPHGSLDPFDLHKHALLKRVLGPVFVRWLLSNSAGVVCTAELEAERLECYGVSPKTYSMPLPVPLSIEMGDGTAFRVKHGIPVDAQVVLFLSRVDYKKGLDFLIPALRQLKQIYPRLWFVLAGSGAPEFTMCVRRWLMENGVNEFTREVGFLSGVSKRDAFAAADLFALPSLNENFGIVNIEAMDAGLPLLISDQVYICREIAAGGAGVVCAPTVESVTMHLGMMLGNPAKLRLMGQCGHELVKNRYQPKVATATLMNLYQSIISHAL